MKNGDLSKAILPDEPSPYSMDEEWNKVQINCSVNMLFVISVSATSAGSLTGYVKQIKDD